MRLAGQNYYNCDREARGRGSLQIINLENGWLGKRGDFNNGAFTEHLNYFFLQRTELFQRNLASTSGLMDLQFSPDTPRPRVLRLTQPTSRDVSEMIRRVNAQF